MVGEKFKFQQDQNTLLKLKLGIPPENSSNKSSLYKGLGQRDLLDTIKELFYST